MSEEQQAAAPSPQQIFHVLSGHQHTAILKAGVELDVFTAIANGAQTAAALSHACGAAERGIRMLADGLVILGFLRKDGAVYSLVPDAEKFLVRSSPAYLGGAIEFMLAHPLVEGFRQLTEAVRQGGTMLANEGTTARNYAEWVTFARAMVPLMIGPARWIAHHLSATDQPVRKVLDIAAGHGVFGVEIGKRFPDAGIVAVDWAAVLDVAIENATAAGLQERYSTIPGSAFDVDYGTGYDVVLLTNFLHHFDVPTCEAVLRKVHDALAPGGVAVTLEFVPNEDRVTPASADFALIMLATTPAGDAYTFSELEGMCRRSGFARNELHAVPESKEHVVLSYRS